MTDPCMKRSKQVGIRMKRSVMYVMDSVTPPQLSAQMLSYMSASCVFVRPRPRKLYSSLYFIFSCNF